MYSYYQINSDLIRHVTYLKSPLPMLKDHCDCTRVRMFTRSDLIVLQLQIISGWIEAATYSAAIFGCAAMFVGVCKKKRILESGHFELQTSAHDFQ